MEIKDKEYLNFLYNLKEEDITKSLIFDTFGEFNGRSEHKTDDYFIVPPNTYGPEKKKNKNSFTTTLGLWFFNKLFIEKELFDLFGYINKPNIGKKQIGNMNQDLSYAVLEDKIPLEALKHFQLKLQVMMGIVSVLSPNYSTDMLTVNEKIDKKKMELVTKYKDELQSGNEVIAGEIEKELMTYARELLKDDVSMDIWDSGAIGSFDNNFKNMFVMKGAILDTDPTKGFNISTSSYMSGISKEDYAILANSLPSGPYARAKKTEVGGYLEKLFMQAFQHVILDKPGSDCGTKKYITVNLNNNNIGDYMYSYIIQGDKLIELNSDNMDKYINKTIRIRYTSMCQSKTGVCNKCAGNLYYRLDIKNIGMSTPKIATNLKNKSMKSFHDSSVKLHNIDISRAFGFE